MDYESMVLPFIIFPELNPLPAATRPNKRLEQYALHASCALLSSQQPARRTPGVAELVFFGDARAFSISL